MGWSIGYDDRWQRDVGYGVPAYCDHPGCMKEIDRGLPYVCGEQPYGGDHGCGLFFCSEHMRYAGARRDHVQLCERCFRGTGPFSPTPDHPDWMRHQLTDKSWAKWRKENPDQVKKLKDALLRVDR